MAGQNDFYPFATGSGANVYTVASYMANAARQTGVVEGEADPLLANNAWRQGTVLASMIGDFIAAQNYDARDNGDIAGLRTNFQSALGQYVGANVIPSAQRVHYGLDTGTQNSIVANVSPDIASYVAGALYQIRVLFAPTGAVVANLDGQGARAVVRSDGTQIQAGDWGTGDVLLMSDDGSVLRVQGIRSSNLPARRLSSFTAAGNYTFTVPAGVFWIFAECVGAGGGGGGGGGGATWSSGGGGSGGYAAGWFSVNPGDTIALVVGAKGIGANNGNNAVATTGGTTTVGSLMQASGGTGGRGGGNGSPGGTPGIGLGGQRNLYGSNGGDGNPYSNAVQGGQGAASAFGGGGRTATNNTGGVLDGLAPGSGGGGIWYTNTAQVGGNGADGAIFIQY